jgi:uncharacterized damage-inducible protein DinB
MNLLPAFIFEFERMKKQCDSAIAQVTDEQLFLSPGTESNSIAIIMQHLAGNMISRWTDFLTSDGEKAWRNRDAEFEATITGKAELLAQWEQGWDVFLTTLRSLSDDDLAKTVTIRNEPLTALQAIFRQVAHYSYHTGQLVFVARLHCGANWQSLSIPKGKSASHQTGTYLKP